jgi:hypothetical protein
LYLLLVSFFAVRVRRVGPERGHGAVRIGDLIQLLVQQNFILNFFPDDRQLRDQQIGKLVNVLFGVGLTLVGFQGLFGDVRSRQESPRIFLDELRLFFHSLKLFSLLFSLHFFVVNFFGGRQLLVDVGERRVVVVGGVAALKKKV